MAGTTRKIAAYLTRMEPFNSLIAFVNGCIDDLETLRAASFGVTRITVADLAAGADITARAEFVAPFALTILDSVKVIPIANSTGVDAGNTLVITLRNITEGADIATVTRAAGGDLVANTPVALTLAGAAADVAANDVLGVVVTQGATADTAGFYVQFAYQRQTVDAAGDLTAPDIETMTIE